MPRLKTAIINLEMALKLPNEYIFLDELLFDLARHVLPCGNVLGILLHCLRWTSK